MLKIMTEEQLDRVANTGKLFGACLAAYTEEEAGQLIQKEIIKFGYHEYFDAADIFTDQAYTARQVEFEK